VSTTGFGVYLHWPYCTRICPYCDFNVYRARDRDPQPLVDALVADIEGHHARLGKRSADTLFFGGGTPSLLDARHIERLIETVDRTFGFTNAPEISLESNPEDHANFASQVAAGVNRISLGVQALDDAALKALGRAHDAASAINATHAAATTGARVSLDLIYARDGQTPNTWADELRAALALPVEHVSLYQLTIEDGTAFARAVSRKKLSPPDAERAASLYETTQAVCDAAGFPAYEISNHARGRAARSRHNALYWTGGDWIGVGPGAHGRVPLEDARHATKAHDRPDDYIEAVQGAGVGWVTSEALAPEIVADEAILMGLRLDDGLDCAALEVLRGRPLDSAAIEMFSQENLLSVQAGRLRLTAAGRLLADHIAAMLAA
jgi:putative oxygen-independent coproporphyrinogen III oxidase